MSETAFYVALTALVVLGILLVMGRLGRYPLVRANVGDRPLFEWNDVNDATLTFALQLPNIWERFDGRDADQEETFRQQIEASALYSQGTLPLTAGVDDIRYLFLALSPRPRDFPPAFLIVGMSQTLNRLEYEEALQFLQGSRLTVREARMVEEFDRKFLSIQVDVPVARSEAGQEFTTLRCRQQFVRGRSESLIMALCAPEPRYGLYEGDIGVINDSFQRLAP